MLTVLSRLGLSEFWVNRSDCLRCQEKFHQMPSAVARGWDSS